MNKKSLMIFCAAFILIGIIVLVCAAPGDDIIMRLSSPSNAHGEWWNGSYYDTIIKYSDLFGTTFLETDEETYHPMCAPDNKILHLSNYTNAHAETTSGTAYLPGNNGTSICYGDLECTARPDDEDCHDDEVCFVTLSGLTNAHLALCDSYASGLTGTAPYDTKVCCKSPQTTPSSFCEEMKIKEGPYETCWNNSRGFNCTWTPVVNATTGDLTTSEDDGGHCCGEGGVWDEYAIGGPKCNYGTEGICNLIWTVNTQEGLARKKSNTDLGYWDQCCIQISPGGGSLGTYNYVQTY